jgi:hypothetical protein
MKRRSNLSEKEELNPRSNEKREVLWWGGDLYYRDNFKAPGFYHSSIISKVVRKKVLKFSEFVVT